MIFQVFHDDFQSLWEPCNRAEAISMISTKLLFAGPYIIRSVPFNGSMLSLTVAVEFCLSCLVLSRLMPTIQYRKLTTTLGRMMGQASFETPFFKTSDLPLRVLTMMLSKAILKILLKENEHVVRYIFK